MVKLCIKFIYKSCPKFYLDDASLKVSKFLVESKKLMNFPCGVIVMAENCLCLSPTILRSLSVTSREFAYLLAHSAMLVTSRSFGDPNARWR